jgi:hypothetical protein
MTTTPELNNEHLPSPESNEAAAAEQLEKLTNGLERTGEQHLENGEKSEKNARVEALKQAISVEAGGKEKHNDNRDSSPAARRGVISKKQKEASFKNTMKHVQNELPPTARAFSKVIHAKGVEQTSEVLGATIARPNAILAGAVCAFLLTLGLYVLAKNIGYKLSGFETIGAFIVGWVLGIVYDYLRVMITGKK